MQTERETVGERKIYADTFCQCWGGFRSRISAITSDSWVTDEFSKAGTWFASRIRDYGEEMGGWVGWGWSVGGKGNCAIKKRGAIVIGGWWARGFFSTHRDDPRSERVEKPANAKGGDDFELRFCVRRLTTRTLFTSTHPTIRSLYCTVYVHTYTWWCCRKILMIFKVKYQYKIPKSKTFRLFLSMIDTIDTSLDIYFVQTNKPARYLSSKRILSHGYET